MPTLQRLVFLDPCRGGVPRTIAATLSCLADEHRDAGTPIIWMSATPEFLIPRGDLILPGHATTPLGRTIALVETMARLSAPPAHCFAYGDLCADDVVLALVGNPRFVPCCPGQAGLARSRGFVVTTDPPE